MAATYDISFTPVKRASRDIGRRIKFWADSGGVTPAVVKDLSGNVLTQPIRVDSNGQMSVRLSQWPIYISDNRAWGNVRQLDGMPATVSVTGAAIVAEEMGILDAEVLLAAPLVAADVDSATETAAILNADAVHIMALEAKLDAVITALQTGGTFTAPGE